jgi:hypothetical protein
MELIEPWQIGVICVAVACLGLACYCLRRPGRIFDSALLGISRV